MCDYDGRDPINNYALKQYVKYKNFESLIIAVAVIASVPLPFFQYIVIISLYCGFHVHFRFVFLSSLRFCRASRCVRSAPMSCRCSTCSPSPTPVLSSTCRASTVCIILIFTDFAKILLCIYYNVVTLNVITVNVKPIPSHINDNLIVHILCKLK